MTKLAGWLPVVFTDKGDAIDAFAAGGMTDPCWTWESDVPGFVGGITWYVFAPTAGGARERVLRHLSEPQRVKRDTMHGWVLERLTERNAERTLNLEGGTDAPGESAREHCNAG